MKGMFCKRVIVIVIVFIIFCSMVVIIGKVVVEIDFVIDVEVGLVILIEVNFGKILYEKNVDELLVIVSMIKMMSEYLVYEVVDKGKFKWD